MKLGIRVNGFQALKSEMGEDSKFGQMVLYMRDTGKIAKLMGKED